MKCWHNFIVFYGKKQLFKKIYISEKNNQKLNSVIIYIMLYGINRLNLSAENNILIRKYDPKYEKDFIDNNCVRSNELAKDLIKKLLELDIKKRITIDMALNHSFLKDENYNSEKKYSNDCLSLVNTTNFLIQTMPQELNY